MNKEIKVNKNVNEIINGVNNAVAELGKIKDITVRTATKVINMKEISSLASYICNNYDDFKSIILTNNKSKAVVITKM